MNKISAGWIPHLLTEDQKRIREKKIFAENVSKI